MFPFRECLMSLEIFQREFGYHVWDRDSMAIVNKYRYKICRSLAMADHCIQSVSLFVGANLCPELYIYSSFNQEPKNPSNLNHHPWQKVKKKKKKVTQSCPILCDPKNYSLLGSSFHGIVQARILEWVANSFSRGSFQTGDWTLVSCTTRRIFTDWATREALDRKTSVKSQCGWEEQGWMEKSPQVCCLVLFRFVCFSIYSRVKT